MTLDDRNLSQQADELAETDEDRYPTLTQALARINSEIASGGVTVERLELTCLANGEVNCKWWPPRAEDPEFVFLPDPGSG